MAKSYQAARRRRRCRGVVSLDAPVHVCLTVSARDARLLRAEARYLGKPISRLSGPAGLVAQVLRQHVDDLAEDADFMEDLAAVGLDLGEWQREYAEGLRVRANFHARGSTES